jgi:hypothetical protein
MAHSFSGNIFIFHAFDIGDEIDLNKVETSKAILTRPLTLARYFKNYHTPLSIDLPHPHSSSKFFTCKIHEFGVISLVYKIPFDGTLEELKKELADLDDEFKEQSIEDVGSIFQKIRTFIKQPRFFHMKSSYVVVQVDQKSNINANELNEEYSGTIASLVRFETETLSEFQKNEILEDARGYYRGDLLVIDNEAAFIYDDDYEEILDLFEFANIQKVELQYFDRKLGQELYSVYQKGVRKMPFKSYLPFLGGWMATPVSELDMLKVEISAIIERLSSSIKLAGDSYTSETYSLLEKKFDLANWRASVDSKLEIIKDMHTLYQHRIDVIREDSLTILIIVLIMIELIVAIIK